MFRAARRVSTNVSSKSNLLGLALFMPILTLVGALGGCETAPQWVDPASAEQREAPVRSAGVDSSTISQDGDRIAVTCDATSFNDYSSAVATSHVQGTQNGTTPYCYAPPCAIEQGADEKLRTVTVSFDLYSYYDASQLDEPSLTVTGTLKGSATGAASAKTFDQLTSIQLNDIDHKVAVTFDASDFVDITSATLSWNSKNKKSGSDTTQDGMVECQCCEFECTRRSDGTRICSCSLWLWHCP